jgi:hypothetical protein
MASSSNTASIITSIGNVLGSLGPSLGGWSSSATQADGLIASINNAATQGDWAQVSVLANDLQMLPSLSQTSRDIVSSLNTAARTAAKSTDMAVSPGLESLVLASQQQLVRSLTSELHSQIASEGSGIFSNLTHAHFWYTQGTPATL